MDEDKSQHLSQMVAEEINAVDASSAKSPASTLPIARFTSPDGLVGRTIGQYQIGEEIGHGGMGRVHLAEDNSGRKVVVKVVKFAGDDSNDRMLVERFKREARAAGRVVHPNTVRLLILDEIDGLHLLVMEYVAGRALTEEIKGKRGMLPEKAIGVIIEVLTGLEAIHAAGVVHRDLKPHNIMLTHDGDRVKILDYGLATITVPSGDPAFDETLTQAGIPVGTPTYMSPEQIHAARIDARSDLYAVGCILFQLLTGAVPFSPTESLMSVMQKHLNAPVPKIVSPFGMLPPKLQQIVDKAMAKRPEDRYQTAAEMRKALSAVDFARKPPSRGFGVAWALGLVAAIVVAAALALVLTSDSSTEHPRAAAVEKPVVHPTVTPARHAEATVSAPAKVEVPPPPVPVPTVADGCTLFEQGRTSEAISALTRVSASSSESLYCLCGAYARQSNYGGEMQKACKAYLGQTDGQRDPQISKRRTLVGIWLGRVPK